MVALDTAADLFVFARQGRITSPNKPFELREFLAILDHLAHQIAFADLRRAHQVGRHFAALAHAIAPQPGYQRLHAVGFVEHRTKAHQPGDGFEHGRALVRSLFQIKIPVEQRISQPGVQNPLVAPHNIVQVLGAAIAHRGKTGHQAFGSLLAHREVALMSLQGRGDQFCRQNRIFFTERAQKRSGMFA